MTTARRSIALLSALFLVPLIAVTTATNTASAADDAALFKPMPAFSPSELSDPTVRPSQFKAYRADLAGLRAQLAGGGTTTLTIPDPAGTPTEFTVFEDSVMEPELQAAHPETRTYAGGAANGTNIRLDITPFGFHAMVRRPDGVAWYVEPVTRNVGESRVLSFPGGALGAPAEPFVEKQVQEAAQAVAPPVDDAFSTPGGLVTSRTYGLALVTDPAYAAYHAPGAVTHGASDPLVLAAKTSLINRVNQVYNDDVAYKYLLVNGTDTKLNLLTAAELSSPNGPCGANACFPAAVGAYDCGDVLNRNTFALGQLVGADTFDIGHIGLGVAGGGVAGLGVVGGANKARGCTGLPEPTGDVYAIDYVAHEMGHQMGGNHTFNGTQGNCSGGNRNGPTSVEPGSGSSIQAYAGICSSDNLQPHSDPYFSFRSIDEFEATTAAAPTNLTEQQSVNLANFDGTDSFTISCAGCGTSATVTNGSTYTAAQLAIEILAITGEAATVTGYDGGAFNTNGFTVTWTPTGDEPKLTITPVTGTFTTFTGVLRQGGPTTPGGTTAVTANNSPVVNAGADKTIPTRTPFTLSGSATDANSDVLTYLWEQTDAGVGAGTSLTSNAKLNGPLFRVFGVSAQVSEPDSLEYNSPGENLAGTDPTRTFPDLVQILAGNTNAASGTCPAPLAPGTIPITDPALNCFSEFLPTNSWVGTGDRVLHFRLTARDEFTADPPGPVDDPGGVSWDNLALTVDPLAGPFLVTSRATAGSPGSGFETVTWNVAGTAGATLAPNVKISLSTDGGLTFPTVLAASTANDGSEVVILPSVTTTTARIKIEAVGNYFFDINDANFSINPSAGNLTPVVNAGPDASVAVGAPFTSSGSFMDEVPATATATVNYGDGSGAVPLTLTGSTFNLSHTYATAGAKTVTVAVTDASAATGTDTATVTVTSVTPPGATPSVTDASAKPKKIDKGDKFKVKATVTTTPGVPTGTVQVFLGAKLLGTGTLKSTGKVTIKIPEKKAKKLKVGKNTLTVKYLGSATVAASQDTCVIKVRP